LEKAFMRKIPRIVISGSYSGVGKTTVATGLMGAFRNRKMKVQGFKVGPDYIDTSYHTMITNRYARNLDTWMVPYEGVLEIFIRAFQDADIAIIEGAMGLYDGASGVDETGSTAEMARILNAPVILVIDASDMARSAGALVLGYQKFDPNLRLAGVIANGLGSTTHAKWVKDAIETHTNIPVLGTLPIRNKIKMPERHLGLIPTLERGELHSYFSTLADFIEENVNLDPISEIAKSAPKLPTQKSKIYPKKNKKKKVRIGIALDEAFNFYYWDNVDMLKAYGAEITFFSPIHNEKLPDVDGIYIGGGFPEVLAAKLEENKSMRLKIKKRAEEGMPLYAECGGLMYLTDSVINFSGKAFQMVGLFPGITVMTKKLEAMGYTLADVVIHTIIPRKGTKLKGHEFHFSTITNIPRDASFAYKMKLGKGINGKHDGWIEYNVLASYMHMHFGYDKKLVQSFIQSCEKYQRKK